MRNIPGLLDRFKTQLQRNHSDTEPLQQGCNVVAGDRYRDGYGRQVTVIAVSLSDVIYRRDGYGMNSGMRLERFLREFTGVKP